MTEGVVLITGASVGIGYELAKLFAKDKRDLVLIARNIKKLEEVAQEIKSISPIQVYTFAADLTNPESPKQIFGFTQKENLFVETLVNNAGFGSNGYFHELPLQEELNMVQVNVTSLVHLTRLYLPEMVQKKQGSILNVASTAAFQPGPFMSNYYATKAYVLHFTEGLAEEVKPFGIQVSALCPGPTHTEFQKRANLDEAFIFKTPLTMSAKEVAESGYEAFKKGKVVHIPGIINKFLSRTVSLSPRSLIRTITGSINKTARKS